MNRDRRFDVPNSYQDGGSANQSCRGSGSGESEIAGVTQSVTGEAAGIVVTTLAPMRGTYSRPRTRGSS